MNNEIQSAYVNALLADASYVDPITDDVKLTARISQAQTQFIRDNFIGTQHLSPNGGFDAVVWRGKSGTPFSGKSYVSMRGTQEGQDLVDDSTLAARGIPHQQVADMVNWWLKNTAGDGAINVTQIKVVTTAVAPLLNTFSFSLDVPTTGTGILADIGPITAVNGHSLGGYLATAFTRLFGTAFAVQSVSTFNSAGFSNAAAANIEAQYNSIANLIGSSMGLGFSAVAAKQNNYLGENGIEFTTNSWADISIPGFVQYGQRKALYQEDLLTGGLGAPINNHSMYKLTDLLALGAVLEKLDNTLSFATLNTLIKAGSNDMKASYESVLDALRKVLAGPSVEVLPAGDAANSDPEGSRAIFHSTLAALQNNQIFKDLTGQLKIQPVGEYLVNLARNNFGALIALQDLSPLYISGTTPAAQNLLADIWQISRATDYAAWQADRTASVASTFSNEWIVDRAKMHAALITRNNSDHAGIVPGTSNQLYLDVASGTQILVGAGSTNRIKYVFGGAGIDILEGLAFADHLYGGGDDDFIDGQGGDDYIEGNAGWDALYGGEGRDTLLGGVGNDALDGEAGDDALTGGSGDDSLEGGTGNDTYYFNIGAGSDTITDSDHVGAIVYRFANGSTARLNGGIRLAGAAAGVYRSYGVNAAGAVQYDDRFTYTVTGADLVITATGDAGSSITVKDFTSGHLGLTLGDHAAAPAVINGTENDDRPILGGTDFSLRGSASDNEIRGLGGNDHLYGLGGNDVLYGGAGHDLAYGGSGDDVIEGGTGDDDLVGEAGSDVLSGGAGADALSGDLFGMGAGSGNDYLDGGIGNDTLVAGGGNDVLFGGDGGDFLDGDANETPAEFHGIDFLDGGAGNDTLFGSGGSDILLGGADNDTLYGDAAAGTPGDDWLEGGAGDDVLYGNAGNDSLSGGTDTDELRGDVGSDHYYYSLGDGSDTLYDVVNTGDVNTLWLGGGIALATTELSFDSQGYKLAFGDGGSISIKGNYSSSLSGGVYTIANAASNADIQRVEFSDGTGLSWLEMVQRGFTQRSTVVGAAVSGTNYDDTLSGGANATLNGGLGSDTYLFEAGGGVARILDTRNALDVNTLRFGAGISPNTVTLGHGQGALKLGLGSAGEVQLQGFDPRDAFNSVAVDQFAFADGTVLSAAQLLARGFDLNGTAGDDIILGTNAVDRMDGLAGDDILMGDADADVLDGGSGNDELQGGKGNDTYLFKRGGESDRVYEEDATPGNVDTVQMAAGIATGDVRVTRDLSNLYLTVRNAGGTTDRMALQRWFDGDAYQVEQVRFADGTTWDATTLSALAATASEQDDSLVGTNSADALAGLGGDDALMGLQGNDTLQGGAGNDSYYINIGDGHDEVIDSAGSDTLLFGAGVSLRDLRLEALPGSDLRIHYGVGNDSVLVRGGLNNSIERISLPGVGSFSVDQLLANAAGVASVTAMPSLPGVSGPRQHVYGTAYANDALIGFATDTTFHYDANGGWDTIMDFGGVNTIEFGSGIAPEQLEVLFDYLPRNNLPGEFDPRYHLLIDGDAAISVIGDIQYFRFTDGTTFDFNYLVDQLEAGFANDPGGDLYRAPVLFGSSGNNRFDIDEEFDLSWDDGKVAIVPGAGNDFVNLNLQTWGGTSVTYVLNLGDGSDTIWSSPDVSFLFGAGVTPQSLRFVREERNINAGTPYPPHWVAGLAIHYGEQNDVVFVENAHATSRIKDIKFTGGSTFELLDHQYLRYVAGVQAGSTVGGGESGWMGTEGDDVYSSGAAVGGRPSSSQDDDVDGLGGNDSLSTGVGDDLLKGGAGNDTLDGGIGNDVLRGGVGDDTYLVGVGTGVDLINDYDSQAGNTDRVQYAAGVLPSDVAVERQGSNLLLSIDGTSDMVVLQGWFASEAEKIERVEFSNGTVWDASELANRAAVHASGGALQYGTVGDDLLQGQAANELLSGLAGDDTLQGGAGDDVLLGGTGDDTYMFNIGDGVDRIIDDGVPGQNTLRFGVGIAPEYLVLGLGSLLLQVGLDAIHIEGFDPQNAANTVAISRFEFADSTVLTAQQILALGFYHDGTDGDDLMAGTSVTDWFFSYEGNDLMRGGVGDDTYYFEPGDGDDTIEDVDGTAANSDRIIISGVFDPGSVSVQRIGLNLRLGFDGASSVTINDWYLDDAHKVEQVLFDDDTTWDVAQLLVLANVAPTASNLNTAEIYTEDVALNLVDIVASDIDSANTTVTLTLSNVAAGSLNTGTSGAVTSTYNAATGVWSASGETASVNSLLAALTLTPTANFNGNFTVATSVSDGIAAPVTGTKTFTGVAMNDAPMVTMTLPVRLLTETQAFSYTLPGGLFADVDLGDQISLSATLAAGGAPLPAWLVFSPGSRTFSGTPPDTAAGVLAIAVKATDLAGAFSTTSFSLDIANIVNGTASADSLVGTAGRDAMFGFAGNDSLNGGTGADAMVGGNGDDLYYVDNVGDSVLELAGEGKDQVATSISYTLGANLENLTLTGTAAINGQGNTLNNVLVGNAANNVLTGDAAGETGAAELINTLTVYARASAFQGVWANMEVWIEGVKVQTFVVNTPVYEAYTVTAPLGMSSRSIDIVFTNDAYNATTGEDRNLWVSEILLNGRIVSGSGEGTVFEYGTGVDALDYVNTIAGTGVLHSQGALHIGLNGGDRLDGGAGADTLIGGFGNDLYVVDNVGDVVQEAANGGHDIVQSSVAYTIGTGVEDLFLQGTLSINGTGNAGRNTIRGNAGNNRLDGGAGLDLLVGGLGDDIYVVETAGDAVWEAPNSGTDTVESSISFALAADVENLVLTGAAAINGTGNILNNALTGNSANNTLSGGAGADTMAGGLGNDTYVVDNPGDVVTEAVNAGVDTVQSSIAYTLATNLENLSLTGTAAINGQGNTLNNILVGNAASNVLTGDAAGETGAAELINTLTFYAKATALQGVWANMEVWIEGIKVQTFVVNTTDYSAYEVTAPLGMSSRSIDLVYTNDANNTTTGEDRNLWVSEVVVNGRTVNASGAGTVFQYGTGAAALNYINTTEGAGIFWGNGGLHVGLNGGDRLDGGAGADTLIGGFGNDVYVVDNIGDVVQEAANAGHDIVLSSVAYTLGPDAEDLFLQGALSINGTGNAGRNTIRGNSGNNRLDGGAGLDLLVGGLGNDIYVVETAGDAVWEAPNSGTDTVESSISFALAADVENLVLTGAAAISGTGNILNNALTGNSANNTLSGGAGADTMAGGLGNDTYVVDNPGDVVTEAVNAGVDTVQSSIAYTLGANLENLMLTGSVALNGTGNTLNNVLTGNDAANVLDGGLGADTLNGGLGSDTYYVDHVGDSVNETVGLDVDLVGSTITYTLGANLEILVLLGSAPINATGNNLNNSLVGNMSDNIIDGGIGADYMLGGGGNDTFVVDNPGDVVVLTVIPFFAPPIATVQSSITYSLGAGVSNLVLTGVGSIDGYGNDGGNFLVGNAGNNQLNGGAGGDLLIGLEGSDTYVMGRGFGSDTILEFGLLTDTDRALFQPGISKEQLWFRQVANDLEVSIIGTSDRFLVGNWYSGTGSRIEEIKTSDGKALFESQVQNLVNAMAAFAPPAMGETNLSAAYAAQLTPVIVANWT